MMLDTAVQHTLNKDTVMKVLKFGTQQLFSNKTQQTSSEVDQEQLAELLNRGKQFENIEIEKAHEYLGNFQVSES